MNHAQTRDPHASIAALKQSHTLSCRDIRIAYCRRSAAQEARRGGGTAGYWMAKLGHQAQMMHACNSNQATATMCMIVPKYSIEVGRHKGR